MAGQLEFVDEEFVTASKKGRVGFLLLFSDALSGVVARQQAPPLDVGLLIPAGAPGFLQPVKADH